MKRKLLLIGYRGYGDWLFASPILEYLFDEYDIHLETSVQGWELFHDDDRFVSKTLFDVGKLHGAIMNGQAVDELKIVNERWDALKKMIKPDKVVNLFRTIESNCMIEKYQDDFYAPLEERRAKYGYKDFFEQAFIAADIPFPDKLNMGLKFTQENEDMVKKWRESHNGKFVIMVLTNGSGFYKRYPYMKELVHELLEKYDNAVIYLVGDGSIPMDIKHDRVFSAMGNAPYKQMVLMSKYVNLVIGSETGLHVAAGLWGTPKIQLCSASGVKQLCGQNENDYSIQSDCACSPCHKLLYNVFDCDSVAVKDYDLYPSCILQFNKDKIMENIEKIYQKEMVLC